MGEIRGGLGLNCAIELVKDKTTMQQFGPKENTRVNAMLKKKLMDAGLFGRFANPILIIPALIITKDEIDQIISGLDRVIGEIQKEL